MKKILKSCLLVLVAICVSVSFVGCKKKLSPTTVNIDNVKYSNGVTTNGGMTVVYGDYLYFINGTKDNDGKSLKKNTRSAICRVKYDMTTGKTTGDMEVVVKDLVGFSDASLHIFGDFLYYATPCSGENSNGEVLFNKTTFKRYDLVNKKSYSLYTTELNSSSEVVNYAYYVAGETLNLLVYEKSMGTIKSFKIDKKVVMNYEITEVTGCLFSENYGKVTRAGANVDANVFVYYTKAPGAQDAVQSGVKVYKTSPVTNNSIEISTGREIALVTIRAGKLVYSSGEFVYADDITSEAQTLRVDNRNCISRATLTNAIYLENYSLVDDPSDPNNPSKKQLVKKEGSISVFALTKATESSHYFNIFEWTSESQEPEDNCAIIENVSSAKDFSFIGLSMLEEIVTEADEDKGIEEEKRKVLYAFFMESSLIYKIEVAEVIDEAEGKLSVSATQKIQLTATKPNANDGLLIPEIVGNYMFFLSEDSDKNDYLYKIDVTPTENKTDKADKFALEEKTKK